MTSLYVSCCSYYCLLLIIQSDSNNAIIVYSYSLCTTSAFLPCVSSFTCSIVHGRAYILLQCNLTIAFCLKVKPIPNQMPFLSFFALQGNAEKRIYGIRGILFFSFLSFITFFVYFLCLYFCFNVFTCCRRFLAITTTFFLLSTSKKSITILVFKEYFYHLYDFKYQK